MPKLPRQCLLIWIVPLAWLVIAGLAWIYRGGEFITFGIALMPGILLTRVVGISSFSNDDFIWITPAGLIPMFLAGLLLDYARVRLKVFAVSFVTGIVIAYILIAIPFSYEARRLGSISAAAHGFNFDQRDRAIAWQVFCTALGLYISIPGSLLWTLGARMTERSRSKSSSSEMHAS